MFSGPVSAVLGVRLISPRASLSMILSVYCRGFVKRRSFHSITLRTRDAAALGPCPPPHGKPRPFNSTNSHTDGVCPLCFGHTFVRRLPGRCISPPPAPQKGRLSHGLSTHASKQHHCRNAGRRELANHATGV